MVVITPNRSSDWVEALVDSATRGQRHLCIFIEPTSFGAKGQALRIPAAWRLALDWWVVRRGDVLGIGRAHVGNRLTRWTPTSTAPSNSASGARRRRRRRNHSFEIAAVLCVALIAATAWAVLAAGWVHGGGGAIVVAVTSVIEAALLAQARAPRIATAIAAPFLGLAAIVPTTLAAMPAVPGQTVGAIAGHYLRALFTGLASTQDWDFTVGPVRDPLPLRVLARMDGPSRASRRPRGDPGLLSSCHQCRQRGRTPIRSRCPRRSRWCSRIGVVAAAYLGSLGDRWAASRITALDGLGWRFGSSAAAVAVVLTIVALVLPPVSTTDISARLFPHGLGFGSSTKGSGSHHPRTVPTPSASTRR